MLNETIALAAGTSYLAFMTPDLAPPDSDLGTPRTRAVHRAIAEARRGVPVVLAARRPLIVAPAETVGAEG